MIRPVSTSSTTAFDPPNASTRLERPCRHEEERKQPKEDLTEPVRH
jgi:hypothetical protein